MDGMARSGNNSRLLSLLVAGGLATGIPLTATAPLKADDETPAFQVEETSDTPANTDVTADAAPAGPVRLARFSYVKGNVTWRLEEGAEWSPSNINLPLRQGAQIWVTEGGRGEIQFDDGSVLRLGSGALVTLQTLYSDTQGEFTEIRVNEGLVSLSLRHDRSIYQLDTPLVSVKANGPGKIRVGVGDGVEVAVRGGRATVEGEQGKITLDAGGYLDLRDASTPFETRPVPHIDNWDHWNEDRDRVLFDEGGRDSSRYLPANINIVAGDLDDYGSWHDDSEYGHVWCPRVTVTDWRPYRYGHWTWVNPFGWTWVSDEAWGWAPYHYGTWISRPYGWAWVPGPACQYWSPAVVHFTECDGEIVWCSLAPGEVRYPERLAFGVNTGSWGLYFSIGQAGVYYPGYHDHYVARPYNNIYVNRYVNDNHSVTYNRYVQSAEGFPVNHSGYVHPNYIPFNARNAAGATSAPLSAFGGKGSYVGLPRASTGLFTRGNSIGLPSSDRPPVAGPPAVRPDAQASTPNRILMHNVGVPMQALNRQVFRASAPSAAGRQNPPLYGSEYSVRSRPVGSARVGGGTSGLPGDGHSTTAPIKGETNGHSGLPGGNWSTVSSARRDTAIRELPTSRTNVSRPGWYGNATSGRSGLSAVEAARRDLPGNNSVSVNRNGMPSGTTVWTGPGKYSPFGGTPRSGTERNGLPTSSDTAARARESLGVPGRNIPTGRSYPSDSGFSYRPERIPGRNPVETSSTYGTRDSSPFGRPHGGFSGGNGTVPAERRTQDPPRNYAPPERHGPPPVTRDRSESRGGLPVGRTGGQDKSRDDSQKGVGLPGRH